MTVGQLIESLKRNCDLDAEVLIPNNHVVGTPEGGYAYMALDFESFHCKRPGRIPDCLDSRPFCPDGVALTVLNGDAEIVPYEDACPNGSVVLGA